MIQSIEYTYKKGSNPSNEDAYVIDESNKIFAVIDGATGLGGLPGDFAANIVKKTIDEYGSVSPLTEIILKANETLKEETEKLINLKLDNIPKYERSTCGMTAIQFTDNERVHYIACGDCMLFFEHEDGTIRTLTYDHLDRLDAKSIAAYHELLLEKEKELGTSINSMAREQIEEIHATCRDRISMILKENRNKLNTINGYSVIDGSSDVFNFIESGSVSLLNVKKILLLSDGLKMHKDQNGWELSGQFAFEKGIDSLCTMVKSMEKQDPACTTYPRLKKHDDKTGILIHLNN